MFATGGEELRKGNGGRSMRSRRVKHEEKQEQEGQEQDGERRRKRRERRSRRIRSLLLSLVGGGAEQVLHGRLLSNHDFPASFAPPPTTAEVCRRIFGQGRETHNRPTRKAQERERKGREGRE
eukprot:763538-Hanusia_phi.AAC.1